VAVSAYAHRVFAFPFVTACNWSGLGNIAGPRSWINGGSYYTLRVVAHEQGHNFGDYHSKAKKCDTSGCTVVEYGDDRDIMGVNPIVGHMNAFQKERLGWLNSGIAPGVQAVTTSGDYWIDDYEALTGYNKGLKIWNPVTSGYYYVETRAKVGYDGPITPGVTLHATQGAIGYQVDLAPTTTTYDSTLEVGQVFTDAALGLSLQALSVDTTGALVHVTLPVCTPQTPAVTLAAGSFLKYSVTVKNTNSVNCAAASFSFGATVPSGWGAAFSPTSVSLSPGASGTATLTLTAPSGTSGTFPFTVTATDSSSGLSRSATGSVTVATNLTVTASATYTASGNTRSASIKVTAKVGNQVAAGAAITVVVTSPKGATTTLTATAGADGSATVKLSLKPRDPSGTYQVKATASGFGATGQATTSFLVP
jgi:hypothetical protein